MEHRNNQCRSFYALEHITFTASQHTVPIIKNNSANHKFI